MAFKKLRGVNLPEEKQGLIRFTCLNYKDQPPRMQEKINKMCQTYGGEYSSALFDVMCTRKSIIKISAQHHVSQETLYIKRRLFYEHWF